MFQNIGFTELLLIAVVALVLFGPNKLPEIGRVLGRTFRDFKKGAYELMNDEPKAASPAPAAVQQAPQASAAAEEQAPAAVVAFASGSALDEADVSQAPAVVAFATSAPALDKADAPSSAPAAVQPAEKAAVAFISSTPGPELTDLAEDSSAHRATSTPAATATPEATVQPSHPRRLPD
ncbi:twin-arginine translocase TatA/TatE family subunit [Paenibacillus sp. CGMCC 1.16610]|uniref:Sec-independent protein translocase protein TatA n=1 Tax=Paenibacillus anseongense TaxID=2682845 RepID=A0ABW9U0P8_9BACL|nr:MULTISPECIES: twin-arginine translocase TatA/TatE family subunit [Paenibacillus]MBA2943175.1 twin-arginine translocase TatA/TatE family subunit [Paenibacillus sp. CGMCC 1.16610]MVQ33672.1 twin-arginine translocase TatA/TatE family subunit [Paenibacillus anseongense]